MTHPVLELAAFLDSQWQATLTAIRSAHETRLCIHAGLAKRCGELGGYLLDSWDTHVDLCAMYARFARQLQRSMSDQLASSGYPATVSLDDFAVYGEAPKLRDRKHRDIDTAAFFLLELDHAQSRSLNDLGHQIVSMFSPDNARAASLTEASQRVYAYFASPTWVKKSTSINHRKGRAVLTHKLYGDSYSPWMLNYDGRNALHRVMSDIYLLMNESGKAHAVSGMDTNRVRDIIAGESFSSRLTLQTGPGLSLVFFKDKIEFHFAQYVLDALQSVMATYRTDVEQAA